MPTPSMLKEISGRVSSALAALSGASHVLKAAGERQPFVPSYASGRPTFATWSTDRAIEQGLKASVWVYACVRTLASLSASIPFMVEAKVGGEWEGIPDHPLAQLLTSPNAHMSGQDLMERTCYHLNLGGNAIWHIVSVGAPPAPIELWPLPPDKIKPIPHERDWITGYEYHIGQEKRKLEPTEVMHLQFTDPSNPYWGLSPLQAAARVVDTDVEAVRWNKVALQNRAVTDGLFKFEQPMNREQYEDVREMVRDQHQGVENAHDPWVLGYGADYKQMALTPVEMDFLKSRQFHVSEIAAVYKVPVVLLSPERATFNNMTMGERMLWLGAIIPYLEDICSAINLGLVPFWDPSRRTGARVATLRVRPDLSNVPALHALLLEKIKAAKELWEMGVPFNVANQHLRMGLPDVVEGDLPKPRAGGAGLGRAELDSKRAPASAATEEDEDLPHQVKAVTKAVAKDAYWKAFDGDRAKWEKKLKALVAKQFLAEGDLVAAAYEAQELLGAMATVGGQQAGWEGMLNAAYSAEIEHFGQLEGSRLMRGESAGVEPAAVKVGADFVFDPNAEVVQTFVARHTASRVGLMIDTTKRHVATAIGAGLAENEGSGQIAKRIRDIYKRWAEPPADALIGTPRSMLIARTESGMAANYGHHAAAKQTGLPIEKEWLTARDERVRERHSFLDGKFAKLDETFPNGMLYPNDPSGPPSEICNCRCVVSQTKMETPTGTTPMGVAEGTPDEFLEEAKRNRLLMVGERKKVNREFVESAHHRIGMKMQKDEGFRTFAEALVPEMSGDVAREVEAVRTLADMWSCTSGDNNTLAVALQLAAKEEFNLKNAAVWWDDVLVKTAIYSWGEDIPAMRKFLRAVYDESQAAMKASGIKKMTLYRGMVFLKKKKGFDWPKAPGLSKATVKQQPMASFSADVNVLEQFVDPNLHSVMLCADVPAERILSMPRLGFGTDLEVEAMVLGGKDTVAAISWVPMGAGADIPGSSEVWKLLSGELWEEL